MKSYSPKIEPKELLDVPQRFLIVQVLVVVVTTLLFFI